MMLPKGCYPKSLQGMWPGIEMGGNCGLACYRG
jgi:hypothetical protein